MDLLRCRCGRGANRKGVQAWINNLRAWACCSSPDSGPSRVSDESKAFYVEALGLPLKPMPGNESYLLAEQGALDGVKHFALWPLAQAAQSCFGDDRWPADLAAPQAWIEFDVADMALATQGLIDRGYRLLVANREEPWGKALPVCSARKGCWSASPIRPGCVKRRAVRRCFCGGRLKNKFALA